MKKIKWGNVLKTILFILCIGVVMYDIYFLTIYPFITSKLMSFTWIGLITNILSVLYIGYFIEEVKRTLQ